MRMIASRSSTTARLSRKNSGARRDLRAGQREHAEGKSDVRRDGNGPALVHAGRAETDGRRDDRGNQDAAARRDDREHRGFAVREFADHQFTFEFEAGDEEEDGKQSVLRPRAQAEVEMECGRTDLEVT